MVRIKSMPADGSCLFWALGWWYDVPGPRLRSMLIDYIASHPSMKINGVALSDWIRWDSDMSLSQYLAALRKGLWGGATEMAIFSSITGSAVSVWEVTSRNKLKRITHIDGDEVPHCHLVYLNRNHYGVLTN